MAGVATIIGGGVIGAGWAARFLLNGWDVRVFDPEEASRIRVRAVIDRARKALPGLGNVALPPEGQLSFPGLMSEAVQGADWVQESIPERLELKQKTYQLLQRYMAPEAILGSSTSGFMPSELQARSNRPDQIVVTHPFNPVYLLPLVEVVTSLRNGAERKTRAEEVMRGIGMYPLQVKAEIPAHIADRLLEAVWREALWMVRDGVATTGEIDDAIRMGFGLRWAQMGLFETYRIAGGPQGMAQFLSQLGPALKLPRSRLSDVPEMDDELVRMIAEQSDAQSGALTIEALEEQRDRNLVRILRGLAENGAGAGQVLRDHDRRNAHARGLPERFEEIDDLAQPLVTLERAVPLDALNRRGQLSRRAMAGLFADALERLIGLLDPEAGDCGLVAAESHMSLLASVEAGAPIRVEARAIAGGPEGMHLWSELLSGDRLLATAEHHLRHLELKRLAPVPMPPSLTQRVRRIVAAQQPLPRPEGVPPMSP